MKKMKRIALLLLALVMLAGCGQNAAVPAEPEEEEAFLDEIVIEEVSLEDEIVALSAAPVALPSALLPEASGTAVKKNSRAIIDYSNVQDGYVMVQFTDVTDRRLKVQVFGPTTQDSPYKYNLTQGEWTTFPLSDGNGTYKVTVYEQKDNGKYASVVSVSFDVTMTDEFAPFLRPNQYVNYADAENTLAQAAKLVEGITKPLDKVEAVYNYVVKNFTYDYQKAKTVQSGYLPVLDDVLAAKTGICFDYAAVMTGMLRSQGVPCKLVIGYAGTEYHAWVSVWTEETGWIDSAIYFDGNAWHRLDPTFASGSGSSKKIMDFIAKDKNYDAKLFY